MLTLLYVSQLDLKSYVATIEYTETEEEENNVKILDLVKSGEIAFSKPVQLLTAPYRFFSVLHMCTHIADMHSAVMPAIMATSANDSASRLCMQVPQCCNLCHWLCKPKLNELAVSQLQHGTTCLLWWR